MIHKIADILGITLRHATTKHAQSIGVLEITYATIKISQKKSSGEILKQWHKYLPLACLNYNTTFHASIKCQPSRIIHGRVPYNVLDHKLGLNLKIGLVPITDFVDELLRRTQFLYHKTKKDKMLSKIRYRNYYDKKAKASPLQEKDYCYKLQPRKQITKDQKYYFEILDGMVLTYLKNTTQRKLHSPQIKHQQNSNFTSDQISEIHYPYACRRQKHHSKVQP